MLTDSPVVRSAGPRLLFMLGAVITVLLLLWMHGLRTNGDTRGLTTIFFILFVYEDYGATICELLILIGAVFLASRVPVRIILREVGSRPWTVAAISTVVLCLGALLVYHDHPVSMDEYTAYFQSQIFAAGHITGRLPLAVKDWLIPEGFQDFFLQISHANGRVASMYWPGHALIMAPFFWIGAPWACNPVLTALTLVVVHRLALELFQNVEAAGLALLLTLASPVIFGMGISYYSMPAHLLLNCCYVLLLLKPTAARVLGAGVVGSLSLVLHNPVPHTLFAIPWFVWVATRPGGVRLLALLCAGYLPLFLLLGVGWLDLSNHIRTEGRDLSTNAAATTVLDRVQGMLAIVAAPSGTVLLARIIGIAKVWIWAVPGIVILACCGAVRWRANPLCRLLTATALTTLIGYLFFPPDQGHGWGFRYFHSAWMVLPLLATAALFAPAATTGPVRVPGPAPRLFEDPDTGAYLTACIVLTLIFGVGWRAWQMQAFVARDIAQLPKYQGTERRVVIVDDRTSFYGGDLVQNDPWLRGSVIRMYSHGAEADAQMMARYYPTLHRVYADRYGAVWSAMPTPGSRTSGNDMPERTASDAARQR